MKDLKSQLIYEQWKIAVGWTTKTINKITDDQFLMEISPGKNTGIWVLGHLIHTEDKLSEYLGKGDIIFPFLMKYFASGTKPISADYYPPIPDLRELWEKVILKNDKIISQVYDKEWEEPHKLINNPDSLPFETKGGCLYRWALHQMYHNWQLVMLASETRKSRVVETLKTLH